MLREHGIDPPNPEEVDPGVDELDITDGDLVATADGLAGLISLEDMTISQMMMECDHRGIEVPTMGGMGGRGRRRRAPYLEALRGPMLEDVRQHCPMSARGPASS